MERHLVHTNIMSLFSLSYLTPHTTLKTMASTAASLGLKVNSNSAWPEMQ